MQRADLISKLETVKPALAVNQLIELLTHFWFTGKRLMAFNDQIAISIPFPTDFEGAVSAKLLELLRVKDGAPQVEVVDDGRGNLVVRRLRKNNAGELKPGKDKIRLAMLEPEFIFKMPVLEDAQTKNGAMRELIDAVEHCLLSVGSDTSAAEHLGVTFEKDPSDERRTVLYSTDSATLSRAYIKSTNAVQLPHRAIVPGLFCQQMLRLYRALSDDDRKKGRASFRIGSRQIQGVTDRFALFTAGPAILYGRLLETRSPLDFAHVLGYHLPKQWESALVTFPDRLRGAIDRAFIICDEQRKKVQLKVEGRRLYLSSQSENSSEEVRDELQLDKDHSSISVSIEPRFLRRAPADFEKLLVVPLCVILAKRDRGMLYLVSTQ